MVKTKCDAWMTRAYGTLWKDARKSAILRFPKKLTESEQHSQNVKRAIKLAKEGA